jgi:hypothetical protein
LSIIKAFKTLKNLSVLNALIIDNKIGVIKKKVHLLEYTGCNRRNVPNFGRVFLMLNYTEKTQNTYIQS